MTPDRRDELRRAEDAIKHARYTLDRKNYMATITAQEARISALESLLAEFVEMTGRDYSYSEYVILANKADAILPATEVDK